eukprot:1189896-Pleurochrysis_carterae.AAC.1
MRLNLSMSGSKHLRAELATYQRRTRLLLASSNEDGLPCYPFACNGRLTSWTVPSISAVATIVAVNAHTRRAVKVLLVIVSHAAQRWRLIIRIMRAAAVRVARPREGKLLRD